MVGKINSPLDEYFPGLAGHVRRRALHQRNTPFTRGRPGAFENGTWIDGESDGDTTNSISFW